MCGTRASLPVAVLPPYAHDYDDDDGDADE